jgi:hypothetical protein
MHMQPRLLIVHAVVCVKRYDWALTAIQQHNSLPDAYTVQGLQSTVLVTQLLMETLDLHCLRTGGQLQPQHHTVVEIQPSFTDYHDAAAVQLAVRRPVASRQICHINS